MGTIILAGALLHQTQAAAIMCGGALTVGSSVYQRIGRSQIGPMVLATLGMGVSAIAGTVADLSPVAVVVAVAVWGFVAGILPALAEASGRARCRRTAGRRQLRWHVGPCADPRRAGGGT